MSSQLVTLALVVFCAGSLRAAAGEPLRSKVYYIPDGSGIASELAADAMPRQEDYRAYLKEHGIELPADGEATWDNDFFTLTVRAPIEIIKKVDALVQPGGPSDPICGRVNFSVVEFAVDPGVDLHDQSYQHVREMAGSTWRTLDRVSAIGLSGYKVTSASKTVSGSSASPKVQAETESKDFAPNEYGSILEMALMLGPNYGISLELHFAYRSLAAGEQPELRSKIDQSVNLQPSRPLILQITTQPSSTGAKTIAHAVIVEATLIDAKGRNFFPHFNPPKPAPAAGPR